MNLRFKFYGIRRFLIVLIFAFSFIISHGQQTPLNPVSYRILTPFVFNPAIAGSKDFFSVDLSAGKHGKDNSQLLSGHTRLSKTSPGYFSSQGMPEFTNIGVGGYVYDELNGLSRNIGIGGTGSYHYQLDRNALSFLSAGVAVKALYHNYSGNPDLGESEIKLFCPNLDAGIYFYNTNIYAGISATNLLGTPSNPDSLSTYAIPVSRQIFFLAGYKFILSRSFNLLLEPSVIINSDDAFSEEIIDMIEPALKLYAGNFCIGTYFNDFDKFSFFFQYKYPAFYISTYFALPNNSPFYRDPLVAEFAVGVNISAIKSGFSRLYHW